MESSGLTTRISSSSISALRRWYRVRITEQTSSQLQNPCLGCLCSRSFTLCILPRENGKEDSDRVLSRTLCQKKLMSQRMGSRPCYNQLVQL